jgi:hypothetical protein
MWKEKFDSYNKWLNVDKDLAYKSVNTCTTLDVNG